MTILLLLIATVTLKVATKTAIAAVIVSDPIFLRVQVSRLPKHSLVYFYLRIGMVYLLVGFVGVRRALHEPG